MGSMTFTYTGDPNGSNRDKVRFLLQDTTSTDAHLTDEEIAYLLSVWNSNVYDAAIAGAEIVAASYAHRTNYSRSVGDLSISEQYGASAGEFRALADRLRKMKSDLYPPVPKFNSQAVIATEDKLVQTYKTDFKTGMMDNTI
jgi:hypothetical protein